MVVIKSYYFERYFFKEFYYLKAKRTGRLKKGGVPDITIAARGLLEDWNK